MPSGIGSFHSDSSIARNQEKSHMRSANLQMKVGNMDPNLFRKPEYHVYIYSVVDERPSGSPLMRHQPPLTRNLRIAECPRDKRYVEVCTIAHPVNQPDINPMNDQPTVYFSDAKRVAQDIVNPSNLSLNQDAVLRPENVFADGDDYGKLGVFWSLHNPPLDEEVAAAIKRKEDNYRMILNNARQLEVADPKQLNEKITVTHHVAADYFGEEHSWHRTAKRAVFCPNCGESLKGEHLAYHRDVDGVICVIDWERTVAAGKKTRKDVPVEKRWWLKEEEEAKS